MSARREHPLKNFASYADQERKDLEHGQQLDNCRKFADQVPNTWQDSSQDGSWTPDED